MIVSVMVGSVVWCMWCSVGGVYMGVDGYGSLQSYCICGVCGCSVGMWYIYGYSVGMWCIWV